MKLLTKLALSAVTGVFTLFATAQVPPLNDPQIVGVVIAANQIDIDAGHLALTKSQNPQVTEFAQQMVTDHTAVQKSVTDLGAKLHVTPAESSISTSLKKQAATTTARLQGLSGAAFDKAYIDNEVTYHTAVINVVSTALIPNAQNAELKSALTGAVPMFQGHLQHAKNIQASLGSNASTMHH